MFFDDLEARRAEIERHQENSGRLAEAFARFESVGLGSMEFGERVDFGLTFIEEPFMSYGAAIDLDALDEMLGNEASSITPAIPIATGVVTDWDRDDRGFYVGAWVGVRIWYPYEDSIWEQSEVEMQHHYTFKGVAIKDVPTGDRDE